MTVTREDIERWYSNEAASPVRAPLDRNELNGIETRPVGTIVSVEAIRGAQRFIDLSARWLGVVVEAGAYQGALITLEPWTYPVASFGSDHFVVRSDTYGTVALVHAL